ncbi:hypothetical protein DMENIID0001_042940 [Sergentomyia squamirostris]
MANNEKKFYKVWNSDRSDKRMVMSPPEVKEVLQKASARFNKECKILVLEECGTVIDDDEFLLQCDSSNIIFMALKDEEIWESSSIDKMVDKTLHANSDNLVPMSQNVEPIAGTSRQDCVMYQDQEQYNERSIHHNNVTQPEQPSEMSQSHTRKRTMRESEKREHLELWNSYKEVEIPYKDFPSNVLEALQQGKRLSKLDRYAMRSFMVSWVRDVSYHIPKKIWEKISKQICQKYPAAVTDMTNNRIIPPGYMTFANQMRWFNNELNRSGKITTEVHTLHRRNKKVKRDNRLSAGNIENAPDIDPEDEDLYPQIRHDINEFLPFPELIEKYGFLKDQENLLAHFNRLVANEESNAPEERRPFETIIQEDYNVIFQACNKYNSRTRPREQEALDMEALIRKVSKKLLEKEAEIIVHNDADTTVDALEVKEQRDHPTIEIIDNDPPEIFIIYRGICFHKNLSIVDAVQILLMDFHVFNILYPPHASRTLEFFQRYCHGIHPSGGTRSQAYTVNNISLKVLGLINKIEVLKNGNK